MTLLDWFRPRRLRVRFAMAALVGETISAGLNRQLNPDSIPLRTDKDDLARKAWAQADAMLDAEGGGE